MVYDYERVAAYLLTQTKCRPQIGIICGSGLSGLSKAVSNPEIFNYNDIPGFPKATVAGHSGELVFGNIGDFQCVCMKGRFHFYEGNSMNKVVMPVRVMRLMGVKFLIVTNAAGGLNTDYNVGDIMVMQDHLGVACLAGSHPLTGPNNDQLGPRFPAMSDAYDPRIQSMFLSVAKSLKLDYKVRTDGCYCMVSGPCYESRSECVFLKSIGGDAVGMSTVPEVIAAKHCGMKILGLSLITNKVVTNKDESPANHAEVLEAGKQSGIHVEAIVRELLNNADMKKFVNALPAVDYKIPANAANASSSDHGDDSNDSSFFVLSLLAAASIAAVVWVAKSRHAF